MTQTGNSFDELAKDYAAFREGYSESLYDGLLTLGFHAGMSVLDVGCGTGIASEPLSRRGMSITGVDPSAPMLDHARTRIPAGTFVQGTAEELPFDNRSFDGVICAQAIHWFDREKAIAEMIRVVKPGGRVAIWWKSLTQEDPLRAVRAEACKKAGVEPPADLMAGAFGAFYGAAFKERWFRAVPMVVTTNVEKWMGYEHSRCRARTAYGKKLDDYFSQLQKLLRAKMGDGPFSARYTQFLYIGEVG